MKELNTLLIHTSGICEEMILVWGNAELLLKFSSLLGMVHCDKYCSAPAVGFKEASFHCLHCQMFCCRGFVLWFGFWGGFLVGGFLVFVLFLNPPSELLEFRGIRNLVWAYV